MPESRIPVHRPLLPSAERLAPYLARIDDGRWYSNHGPLVAELARRLEDHYGVDRGCVQPVVNGTGGLTAALLALDPVPGALCLMPSWTFAATGHAAFAAGLQPFLADVDEESWALTPAIARAALRQASQTVAAVIVVAPFGAPLALDAWEEFARETGVPVVVDAAAAFDTVRPSSVPVVVSLHATKILAAGEGGFVLCRDQRYVARVLERINFGFLGGRQANCRAGNGKMSEYHAAVALAALDVWPETRARFLKVCAGAARRVAAVPGTETQTGYGETWASSLLVVRLRGRKAEEVAGNLALRGIESRRWWEGGLHTQPAFSTCPRTGLDVTETLAREILGLPCYIDQTAAETERIVAALHDALLPKPD